jgi:hypothetical protein
MFLSKRNSPVVNTMLPVTANEIVSPSFAIAIAWRNDPGPLSLVFVTVIVVARAETATAQKTTAHRVSTLRQKKCFRGPRVPIIYLGNTETAV